MRERVLPAVHGIESFLAGDRKIVISPDGDVHLCVRMSPKEMAFLEAQGLLPSGVASHSPTAVPSGRPAMKSQEPRVLRLL